MFVAVRIDGLGMASTGLNVGEISSVARHMRYKHVYLLLEAKVWRQLPNYNTYTGIVMFNNYWLVCML